MCFIATVIGQVYKFVSTGFMESAWIYSIVLAGWPEFNLGNAWVQVMADEGRAEFKAYDAIDKAAH